MVNNIQLLGLGVVSDPNARGSYSSRYPHLTLNEVNVKERQIASKYDVLANKIAGINESFLNAFGYTVSGRAPIGSKAKATAELELWLEETNRYRAQLEIQAAQAQSEVLKNQAQKAAEDARALAALVSAGLVNKSTAVEQASKITNQQAKTYATNNTDTAKKPNWLLIGGIGLGVAALVTVVVIATK